MFDYREFIMKGFKDAIGKMPDYKVILNASGHFEKGVLEEKDLAELQMLIDEKNKVTDDAENITDEVIGENTEASEVIENDESNDTDSEVNIDG